MFLSAVLALLQMAAAPQSEDALREARRAQAHFEAVRRANLPWDNSGGANQPCSAYVGRYCYWYDSTDRAPEPEPERIKDARAVLLSVLTRTAELHPEDNWVAGQRVRYLIESGDHENARVVARGCRAERWWCAALEGLALHTSERFSEADSVFAASLRTMPEATRCEWMDLRVLLERPLEREFSRAQCAEREQLANRLWTVSQPLWSVAGNDLRTEHFARKAMSAAMGTSSHAQGFRWSGDDTELVLRYGWNTWYTRRNENIYTPGSSPIVTGHSPAPSYLFFPLAGSFDALRVSEEDWNLRDPLARTRYKPSYLNRLTALPHQLARFPRGDSVLIAVAFRAADSVLAGDSTVAWLVTIRSADDEKPSIRDRRPVAKGRGTLLGMIERDTVVASLEVRGDSTRRAARARYTVAPLSCPDSWCLSDLLLFDGSRTPAVVAVDSVLRVASPELRFSRRDQIGVFWEVQRAADSRVPVWLSLTVSPLRISRARRIATRLRLARDLTPVRLRWQTTLEQSRESQHITMRLPPNARGAYRVLLTIEPPGLPAKSAAREIEVLP